MASNPVLADYIRVSKYALNVGGRRETWPEQVDRMFDMHLKQYGPLLEPIRDYVDDARDMMLEMRALGSQRGLQFGGTPILRRNQRIYNCTVSHANRPRVFQEAFHLLLCGSGVGFSVQTHHVAMMPQIRRPTGNEVVHVIEDSIEGWADALGVLLSSYFVTDQPFPEYHRKFVEFDASQVRPKGAPISSGSKAPGPEPLLRALEAARAILDRVINELKLFKLRAIDVYDIMMHAADAVLAGGVRRSASIAIFSPDDWEMVNAKAFPRWWDKEPQRQRSNNSAVLLRGSTDYEVFVDLVEHTKQWGEPGFYWTDDLEQVPNPCVEIGMWPCLELAPGAYLQRADLLPGTYSGVEFRNGTYRISGWQMCNLSTMHGGLCHTPEAFYEACQAASVLSTLQAGYTKFEYLGWVSEKIVEIEALLGVSITGMMDNPDVLFDPDVLEEGARIVMATNEVVAAALGINPAARGTCIKPEGKSSLILDTLAAGIHPWPATRGIRHVRASVLESPFQHFKRTNPHAVFRLAASDPNYDNTEVIAFPFEAPEGALTKADVSAIDLLERVILVRNHWIEPGTKPERCVRKWLRHNVSNTIYVGPDGWEEVTRFIYDKREHFAGVALFPESGDKFYHLAPNLSALTPEEQIEKYGDDVYVAACYLVFMLPDSFGGLWPACDIVVNGNGGQHPGTELVWMQDFEYFAEAHFGNDYRAAEVCVKDAEVWERYVSIKEKFVVVDWSTMDESGDDVDFVGNAGACDGAKCEIDFSMYRGG